MLAAGKVSQEGRSSRKVRKDAIGEERCNIAKMVSAWKNARDEEICNIAKKGMHRAGKLRITRQRRMLRKACEQA